MSIFTYCLHMDKGTHTLIILHSCGSCNLSVWLLVLWLLALNFGLFFIEGAYSWHKKHWHVDNNKGFWSLYDLKPNVKGKYAWNMSIWYLAWAPLTYFWLRILIWSVFRSPLWSWKQMKISNMHGIWLVAVKWGLLAFLKAGVVFWHTDSLFTHMNKKCHCHVTNAPKGIGLA